MDECKLLLESLKAEQEKTNTLLILLCEILGADTTAVQNGW